MQNQMQYPPSFPKEPSNNQQFPSKYNSPNFNKAFDKTLPSPSIKHYSSNPNLSLQMNNAKNGNSHSEAHIQAIKDIKKNLEYRSPPSHTNYVPSNHHYPRSPRNEMARSLIVGDTNNAQTNEEPPNGKKQLFKNIPRRQYRMSQTIQDLPPAIFGPKREDLGSPKHKETNFFKKDSFEEKAESNRQIPAFLNSRGGDLKRSQVIEPTFQANNNSPAQFRRNRPAGMKPPHKITVNDFVKLKQLGNGKYGRVYLVSQKSTGFVCALKVIQKKLLHQQQITQQFIRQVKIQMFLNHPNIIKMYGCFDDTTNIYIILEVGTGGQLYHQLKKSQPLSEPRIAFIMKQVCDAVNQIHSLRIIHRDIKPENIVIHDNIIKLCDFGWSVHQDNKLRTTFCGTPLYVCPQILKGREYDEKIDIWSIGIMMYEMVVGQNPFKITREEELIKIVKDQIKIPSYLFVSTEVRDFLDRCLQKNPEDRGTIKELINHPFFKKHQQKNDKAKMLNM